MVAQIQTPPTAVVAVAAYQLRVNDNTIAHLQRARVVQRQAHNLGDNFVSQRQGLVVPVVVPARLKVQVRAA